MGNLMFEAVTSVININQDFEVSFGLDEGETEAAEMLDLKISNYQQSPQEINFEDEEDTIYYLNDSSDESCVAVIEVETFETIDNLPGCGATEHNDSTDNFLEDDDLERSNNGVNEVLEVF